MRGFSVNEGVAGVKRPAARMCGHRAAQRPHDFAAQALPIRFAAVVQQSDAARQVIEHQQGARRDVMRVRRLGGIETAARHALEVAHRIVGRVAHQSAEQRHARQFRQRLRRLRQRARRAFKNSSLRCRPAVNGTPPKCEPGGIEAHFETIAESDERIARQPLSALDAFEQESRPKRRELQIGRHRRIEIGCNVKRSAS